MAEKYELQIPNLEHQFYEFEPQAPQVNGSQPQLIEPQVFPQNGSQVLQSSEPQVPQPSFQLQVQQNFNQPIYPEAQKSEFQLSKFESQVQEVDEESLQNCFKNDTLKESDIEPEINNNVIPMIEKDDKSKKSNTSKNENIFDHRNYGLHKIFIFYLAQTALFVFFGKIRLWDSVLSTSLSVGIGGILLFLFIRCYDEKYDNKTCSIFLIIYFFIYKIFFSQLLYALVDIIKYKNFYSTNGVKIGLFSYYFYIDSKNPTIFGNFDFAHFALFAYYLILIIFTYIKNAHLLIYFIVGVAITIIMFCSLIAINIIFGAITAGFILLEISILLIVLKLSLSKRKLDEKKFIDNMVIIDFYKYGLIMIICYVILTLFLYLLFFICLFLKTLTTCSTSHEDEGTPCDNVNNKIREFSFKPKYVSS